MSLVNKRASKELNDSKHASEIVDNRGKLIYDRYKYDLNYLFNHTPTFSEPHIAFKTKEPLNDSLWGKVADIILTSEKGKITTYMESYKPMQEYIEKYKNLPFIYN